MSIQSEINRIAGAKSDIADAIEDQGVTVPSGTNLDGMANLIGQISGGSEKLNSTQAADAYDPTATYAVGDKVSYAGNVYSCISAISTPEAWDSTHWDQVDPIQDQVDDVRNTLTQLEDSIAIIINGNTSTSNVSKGQYVYVKNSTISGKADGLYTYNSDTQKTAGNTFVSGELDAVPYGGLNSSQVTKVDLTLESGFLGMAYLVADPIARLARIYVSVSSETTFTNNTPLVVVPAAYAPATNCTLAVIIRSKNPSRTNLMICGMGEIATSGVVRQNIDTYADQAMIVGEYNY